MDVVRTLSWTLGVAGAVLGVAVVGVSGSHARALTTYVPGAPGVGEIEDLTLADRAGLLVWGPQLRRPTNDRSPLELGLDFRTERIEATDGTRLEGWTIRRENARGEVILVPGYKQSRDEMLDTGARLVDAGWRVTLMDPRGVGGSEGTRTSLGWHESLDVAAFTRLARERTTGPVVLYGFSAGGAAVLRSLARRQTTQADAAVVEACFGTLRDALAVRTRRLGLPATPVVDLLLFWGQVEQGVSGWQHSPVDYAADVQLPTLVVQGGADWRAPVSQGRAIARALPNGRYAELEDLGHQPGAVGRPLAWERAVEGFLWETFGPPPEVDEPLPPEAPGRE